MVLPVVRCRSLGAHSTIGFLSTALYETKSPSYLDDINESTCHLVALLAPLLVLASCVDVSKRRLWGLQKVITINIIESLF